MNILETDIQYLKGVGERRAKLLRKEIGASTWGDLLYYFPYKHVDRTRIYRTIDLSDEMPYVQLQGEIVGFKEEGQKYRKRLKAIFRDQYGEIELVWFNRISYFLHQYKVGTPYIVFGKPTRYGGSFSIAHPEIERVGAPNTSVGLFYPMYTTSERMKRSGLTSKELSNLIHEIMRIVKGNLAESLPQYIIDEYQMLPLYESLENMHFPQSADLLRRATMRLKLEELFFLRLRMQYLHNMRRDKSRGLPIVKVGNSFNHLYHNGLTFDLTNAQKRVVKEIFSDLSSGHQMNRLLQGDVGSGKTIVALLSMLLAIDNGFQACIMAPTEILAGQHLETIRGYLKGHPEVRVELLTGSMKKSEREPVLEGVASGEVDILVGTHILIQDYVVFKNLGLAVIDEQHRFGVYQRSLLWEKRMTVEPHILIMSATPIPRTLAMTMYGDLDVSVIDELPPGRTPIVTRHLYERQRAEAYSFVFDQMRLGRQIYIVYPLIEESEKSDLESLERGFEEVKNMFPAHKVGMVHGKLPSEEKERQMDAFVNGETSILVATTVIEVGVNVPNATVMLINNAERFGLSQLHQLRGRVGRGAKQSYCILLSANKIGETSLRRLQVMCSSTDGFYIAEEDLKIRGYGDIEGTMQSGVGEYLKVADLARDGRLTQFAATLVDAVLEEDPQLEQPHNAVLREKLHSMLKDQKDWALIS
ncbi:MAG: ATP-dependent DNA helicase RecG [Porphyromonas sp.]|nr:ATP-dependent DNA helicase RecG [Porphyromonas sp.]